MDISDSEDEKEVFTREIISQSLNEDDTHHNHKILHDIKQLGCSRKYLNVAAYRTFLDLCEIRKYEDVSYHYSPKLDIIYLKAQKKKDTDVEIVVPVLSCKRISFKEIEELQEAFQTNFIHLAICDSNALIMYYKVTKS